MRARIALVALLTACALPAAPVDLNGKVGLGIRGGLFKPIFSDHSDYWRIGAHMGGLLHWGVTRWLSLGAEFGWGMTAQGDLRGNEADGIPWSFASGDADTLQVQYLSFSVPITARFFVDSKVNPFIVVGPGLTRWQRYSGTNNVTITARDGTGQAIDMSATEVTFTFGIGTDVFVSDMVSFTVGFNCRFLTGVGRSLDINQDSSYAAAPEWDPSVVDPFDIHTGELWSYAGLNYYFGRPDSDEDGVPDNKDECPASPLGATVNEFGCEIDTDGDGVADGIDKCADTPRLAVVDPVGCPKDSDGDGVFDGLDFCPNTVPGVTVDETGCPRDTDKDGVTDDKDTCPNTLAGVVVNVEGCPVDSDSDGVADGLDKCPNTPQGKEVDSSGCTIAPPEKPIEAQEELLGVFFQSGKADLDPNSFTVLDEVARRLLAYPEVKVEVQGYTDSQGSAMKNRILSQQRAETVRYYLVSRGVAPERMYAVGYGEDYPRYDNKTKAGRERNRRVELKRLN